MNTATRTGIPASQIAAGDTLDTFQLGRIFVASVTNNGTAVVVTTESGFVWRTNSQQLVIRVTF